MFLSSSVGDGSPILRRSRSAASSYISSAYRDRRPGTDPETSNLQALLAAEHAFSGRRALPGARSGDERLGHRDRMLPRAPTTQSIRYVGPGAPMLSKPITRRQAIDWSKVNYGDSSHLIDGHTQRLLTPSSSSGTLVFPSPHIARSAASTPQHKIKKPKPFFGVSEGQTHFCHKVGAHRFRNYRGRAQFSSETSDSTQTISTSYCQDRAPLLGNPTFIDTFDQDSAIVRAREEYLQQLELRRQREQVPFRELASNTYLRPLPRTVRSKTTTIFGNGISSSAALGSENLKKQRSLTFESIRKSFKFRFFRKPQGPNTMPPQQVESNILHYNQVNHDDTIDQGSNDDEEFVTPAEDNQQFMIPMEDDQEFLTPVEHPSQWIPPSPPSMSVTEGLVAHESAEVWPTIRVVAQGRTNIQRAFPNQSQYDDSVSSNRVPSNETAQTWENEETDSLSTTQVSAFNTLRRRFSENSGLLSLPQNGASNHYTSPAIRDFAYVPSDPNHRAIANRRRHAQNLYNLLSAHEDGYTPADEDERLNNLAPTSGHMLSSRFPPFASTGSFSRDAQRLSQAVNEDENNTRGYHDDYILEDLNESLVGLSHGSASAVRAPGQHFSLANRGQQSEPSDRSLNNGSFLLEERPNRSTSSVLAPRRPLRDRSRR